MRDQSRCVRMLLAKETAFQADLVRTDGKSHKRPQLCLGTQAHHRRMDRSSSRTVAGNPY